MVALRLVILVCVLFYACNAEDSLESRKKHHHHYEHELLYGSGLLYYLGFLAIKVKLVLALGIIFTMILFAGKLFAVVKYAEHKEHDHHYHEAKELYYQPPHHESVEYIKDHHEFSGPPSIDEPPFRRYSTLQYELKNKYNRKGDDLAGYRRSMSYSGYFHKILGLLMRLNLTDRIFKEMKMEQENCRRKFVCETQWIAENSSLFRIAMKLMSDSTFESYKSKNGTKSIEECRKLYPECEVK